MVRFEQRFEGGEGVSWVDPGEEHSRQREHSEQRSCWGSSKEASGWNGAKSEGGGGEK